MSAEATTAKTILAKAGTGKAMLGAAKWRLAASAVKKALLFKLKKVAAGTLMMSMLATPVAMHAATGSSGTSGSGSAASSSSKSGTSSTTTSGGTKTVTTTTEGPTLTVLNQIKTVGGGLLGLKPKSTSKVYTVGDDMNKIGAAVSGIPVFGVYASAGLEALGTGLELFAPQPKTTAQRVAAVVRGGRSALHDSLRSKADTSDDIVRAANALSALSRQAGDLPANVAPLVKAYQAASIASPEDKLAADQKVVAEYAKFMQSQAFQVTDAQLANVGKGLAAVQTKSDPATEQNYRDALEAFSRFMIDSKNSTGTPSADLTKSAQFFTRAAGSATRFTSARLIGGENLYGAAVAADAALTAKAAGNATEYAKQMAILMNLGQAAVLAQHPGGGYTVIKIDTSAVATAVAAVTGDNATVAAGDDAKSGAGGGGAPSGKGGGAGGAAAPGGKGAGGGGAAAPAAGKGVAAGDKGAAPVAANDTTAKQ